MPIRGFFRLGKTPGENPAAFDIDGSNDVFRSFFALIPAETMGLYHYVKGLFAQTSPAPPTPEQLHAGTIPPVSPLLIVIAWALLGLTLVSRYFSTLPAPPAKKYFSPEWSTIFVAGVAFTLMLFMDGATLWPGYVPGAVDRQIYAVVGLIIAAGWASYQGWKNRTA